MTKDEIIKRLSHISWYYGIHGKDEMAINEAIEIVREALTAEQFGRVVVNSYIEGYEDCRAGKPTPHENKPLTLNELRKMDGDKIHIRFIGTCKGFYDDEYAPYYGRQEQYIQKYNGMLRACDLPLKYYGEAWLAYRRPPKEDER